MRKKSNLLAILTLSLILLTSCGGGGGGGSAGGGNAIVTPPTTLWMDDSQNYGVVRFTSATPQQNIEVIHSIIYLDGEAIENIDPNSALDTSDPISASVDYSLENGELVRGVFRNAGSLVKIISYRDDFKNFDIIATYIGIQGGTLSLTGATQLSNIPTGSFQYNGFISMAPVNNFSENQFVHGEFTMNVDFDDASGNIVGIFGDNRLNGDFNINKTSGNFRGSNLELTTGSETEDASIYGSFHGNGAEGVTGVFRGEIPNSGMIAGARVDRR